MNLPSERLNANSGHCLPVPDCCFQNDHKHTTIRLDLAAGCGKSLLDRVRSIHVRHGLHPSRLLQRRADEIAFLIHIRIDLVSDGVGAALIALSSRGTSGTAHASVRGDLLVVLSMFASVAWILISKRLMRDHSPLMVTAFVFWIGGAMLIPIVFATDGVPSFHYSAGAWIALAWQGLLATATTTVLWNWALKRVAASEAGIFVNLEPLIGAILGVSFLHEVLGRMALAGGALIIAGALYFSYKPESTTQPESEPTPVLRDLGR